MQTLDEFYVVRIQRETTVADNIEPHDLYIDENGAYAPLSEARQFTTLRQAETFVERYSGDERVRYLIQFCTRERAGQMDDRHAGLIDRIMNIPHPYRRTAYNWLRGRDVRALLLRQSEEVYQRHRSLLLDYGIDVEHASEVVLMRPRRRRIHINTGNPPPDGAPKHLFAPAALRPSVAPVTDTRNAGNDHADDD